MHLGISSLGHIIELGINREFKNSIDLLLKASELCLDYAEKNDIKFVELVLDPPNIFEEEHKQKFIELVNSFSLNKQIHGPFIDVNLCSHNNKISNASIETYIEAAKMSVEINAKLMTIHPGLANFMIQSIRSINKLQLKKAIKKLLTFTQNLDLTICMENMPKNAYIMTDHDNIKEIFTIINQKDLYFTYDTSHFYTTNGDIQQLWENFNKKIRNIHLVDNFSKITDTHPCLGKGKIKFKEIFDLIIQYNYNGPLIIELASAKDLPQSIKFIKNLL